MSILTQKASDVIKLTAPQRAGRRFAQTQIDKKKEEEEMSKAVFKSMVPILRQPASVIETASPQTSSPFTKSKEQMMKKDLIEGQYIKDETGKEVFIPPRSPVPLRERRLPFQAPSGTLDTKWRAKLVATEESPIETALSRLPEIPVAVFTDAINFVRKNLNTIMAGEPTETKQLQSIVGLKPERFGIDSDEIMKDTIQEALDAYEKRRKENPNESEYISALWGTKVIASDVLSVLFAYNMAQGATQTTKNALKAATRKLPDSFLIKVQQQQVNPNALLDALRGTRTTPLTEYNQALDFIKKLSVEERRAIFGVARSYQEAGLKIPITESVTPTALGKFAGVTAPKVASVPPRLKGLLPGQKAATQAGFINPEQVGKDIVNLAKKAKNVDAFKELLTKENLVALTVKGFTPEVFYDSVKATPTQPSVVSEPLLQEAKKYKSAEEFVKAQDNKLSLAETGKPITAKLYHGSPDARFAEEFNPEKAGYFPDAPELLPDNKDFISLYGGINKGFRGKSATGNLGVSFTDSPSTAKSYSNKPAFDYQNSVPMVLERYVELKNPKVYNLGGKKWDLNMEDEMRKALNEGHDGLVFKNILDDYHPSDSKIPANNIIVLDTKAIKTKSQLTDIWNKAQGTPKAPPLVQKTEKPPTRVFKKTQDEVVLKDIKKAIIAGIEKKMPVLREKIRGQKKVERILTDKGKIARRRSFIRAVKDHFGLSDADLKSISQRDIRNMSDFEFKKFLDDVRWKASELAETKQAKYELMTTLREGEFQKVNNYRKAMGLPPISEMTKSQLKQFDEALSPFQRGDIFLSQRNLELIDRTRLKGFRTLREAREFLAKEMGVPIEKVEQTKYDWADLIRSDTALAEKNPFYQLMIERSQESVLKSDLRFLNVENDIDRLAKLSEKSRKKRLTFKERALNLLAPEDKDIVNYLQADIKDKEIYAKELTKEQLDVAHYMEKYYSDAYDQLVEMKNLLGSRFEDIYYPHMRKVFFENVREVGIIKAFKNIKKAEAQDKVVFSIIGEDTGEILSKEKFFANTLYRTGELDPSLNVVKTFKRYVRAFEKKKALDEIIPEIEIYAQSLTPTKLTPKGLEMDRKLKSFVKKYLNNKKGRRTTFGGLVEQHGTVDIALRSGNTFVSLRDLGFNIFSGIAATIGEQVMTYQTLGKLKYITAWKRRMWDTGIARLANKNANKILTENKDFIGKDLWTELAEAGEGITEKFMKTIFGLFSQSSVEANKILLLGSISKEELLAGKLSAERLAKLKIDAGRWRDMGRSMKSIFESTSIGETVFKYKGWAVPIMRTTTNNLTKIAKKLKSEGAKSAVGSKEFAEIYRALELSAILLLLGGYIISEEKDDTFIGKLKAKAYREAMTFLGGINPLLFLSTPRLSSFLYDFTDNIIKIIKLEEYQQDGAYGKEGDLKGVSGMKRLLTPNFLQGAIREDKKKTKDLPSLPSLPPLPSLPKLPSL